MDRSLPVHRHQRIHRLIRLQARVRRQHHPSEALLGCVLLPRLRRCPGLLRLTLARRAQTASADRKGLPQGPAAAAGEGCKWEGAAGRARVRSRAIRRHLLRGHRIGPIPPPICAPAPRQLPWRPRHWLLASPQPTASPGAPPASCGTTGEASQQKQQAHLIESGCR